MVLSLTSRDNHSVHNSIIFCWEPEKTETEIYDPKTPRGQAKTEHSSLLYPLAHPLVRDSLARTNGAKNGQFESNDGYQKPSR